MITLFYIRKSVLKTCFIFTFFKENFKHMLVYARIAPSGITLKYSPTGRRKCFFTFFSGNYSIFISFIGKSFWNIVCYSNGKNENRRFLNKMSNLSFPREYFSSVVERFFKYFFWTFIPIFSFFSTFYV